jgi:hypothetical protein
MRLLRGLMREPLVHFLLAGALLYAGFAWWSGGEGAAARDITVDRKALLQFMQYRAKAFEPATFEAQFDALTAGARQQLIDEYVREEVLYREAQALQLDRGDYVMRQRLVQKTLFLLEQADVGEPTEVELQQYLATHRADYAVAPAWTFTHVFVDASERGEVPAERAAKNLLVRLDRVHAAFNDAPQYGDRFPYLQNYVERTGDFIASHFGAEFLTQLQRLPVAARQWQGPLRSDHGWHLVLITANTPARDPELSELREQVMDDWRRDRTAQLQVQAVQALMRGYRVRVGSLERSAR